MAMTRRERDVAGALTVQVENLEKASTVAEFVAAIQDLRVSTRRVNDLLRVQVSAGTTQAHEPEEEFWLEIWHEPDPKDPEDDGWNPAGCGYDSYEGESATDMLEWLPHKRRRLVRSNTVWTVVEEREGVGEGT